MDECKHFLEKKIVIIGAGISGLACASRLKEYGCTNILILEAKDRVGGRIHTVTFENSSSEIGSHFIEMGAQWIHGMNGNSIYELAHSKGLINENAPNYLKELFDFKTANSEEERKAFIDFIEYMDEKLETFLEDVKEDISVLDYLQVEFSKFLKQYNRMFDLLKAIFDWYCKFQCELSGCTDLSTLSLLLFHQYSECEGNLTVELNRGYSSLLEVFSEKIPNNLILRNKEVRCIDWTNMKSLKFSKKHDLSDCICNCTNVENHPKIKITCHDGNIYDADHVISTIPLGYLKKHFETLFFPQLPETKVRAIKAVGFGTVNKIFLEFLEPFWEPTAIYHVIWTSLLYETFNKEDSSKWACDINRFAYTPSHPNMLCAWIVGDGAIIMENISENEIAISCMALLEGILQKKLPKPKKIIRSRWHSDPHTSGSYSFLSVGCNDKSNFDISTPIFADVFSSQHPVIQFAGEATHPSYFSTVHGAYESGVREATKLFDHYRFNRKLNLRNFCEKKKIVIVGAGLAGLSAAYSLHQMGFCQVVILEAQDQPGGRLATTREGDLIIELGAQWIHGTDNLLYEYVKNHNISCDISDEPGEGKGLFYTSHGGVVEESVLEEMKSFFKIAWKKLSELQYSPESCDMPFTTVYNSREHDNIQMHDMSNMSVHKFFSECFMQHMSKNSVDSIDPVRKGLFDWFLKYETIDNSCDNLRQVSLDCYTDWCDIPDDEFYIEVNHGFKSVIETILSELPNEWVKLKKPVKCINWQKMCVPLNYISLDNRLDDEYPVLLECEDGEKINADIVVMTASVGFIKENTETLFKPSLPEKKAKALSHIGFGTIAKIFLIFEETFLDEKAGFQFVWVEPLNKEIELLLKLNPWIYGITGFDLIRKEPTVLLGWVGGEEAKMMENVKIETITSVCMQLLRHFSQRADIPFPVKTIRSEWFSNKYVKGAYSYRSCKFLESGCLLSDLTSPLFSNFLSKGGEPLQRPVVFFAGEAMNEKAFSSVHGAYQSGLEVAQDILDTSKTYFV